MRADDSAFTEGRGCYTSARIEAGRVRFVERHVERLVGAAKSLGLGDLDPERVRRALRDLGEAAFGEGNGIVRLQASRDGQGTLHLVGVPRALGPEPDAWRATVVRLSHEGMSLAPGLKVSSRLTLALAADAAGEVGVDEALLLDGGGWLVEGARSNVVVVTAEGRAATPPTARGAVAGIARGLVLERVPELGEENLSAEQLFAAKEVVCVNAVRGACPVVQLDGRPVGDGRRGPWAARLADALAQD